MKVLVTGADGLLGSNVIRKLQERDFEIVLFLEKGKKSITLPKEVNQIIYGDILSEEEVVAAAEGMDYVIHCAANTNVWPTRSNIIRSVNVMGVENVIKACLKHDVKRLVSVGTANSFASGELHNLGNETNKYQGHVYNLDYMDSKKRGQDLILQAVKNKNLRAIVVNPTFMLGPFDSKPSSGAMIHAMAHGKIPGYSPGGKNYINVKDAAVGIVNALTLGRIGECYILGHENLTYKEIFQKIGVVINKPAPCRALPSLLVKTLGKVNSFMGRLFKYTPTLTGELALLSCENHYYNSSKAVNELDLPQTNIEEGIRDCYNWFKSNGYIKN